MRNFTAAIFTYVHTFNRAYGDASQTAYSDREHVISRIFQGAFDAVEEMLCPSGSPAHHEQIDLMLGESMELTEILTMMIQDRLKVLHLPEFNGIHECEECIAMDVIAEAHAYLYPQRAYGDMSSPAYQDTAQQRCKN